MCLEQFRNASIENFSLIWELSSFTEVSGEKVTLIARGSQLCVTYIS